jgi:hypothetical protein
MTRWLVAKLSQLDSSEAVEVVVAKDDNLSTRFVRTAWGEVFTEIRQQD